MKPPFNLDSFEPRLDARTGARRAYSDAILAELGYARAEIDRLRRTGRV
jgi:hypothetical protein